MFDKKGTSTCNIAQICSLRKVNLSSIQRQPIAIQWKLTSICVLFVVGTSFVSFHGHDIYTLNTCIINFLRY